MKIRRAFWLSLVFLVLIAPSSSLAKDPQGSAASFLPNKSPIETESEPIYEKYALPAYQIDSEKNMGWMSFGMSKDEISNGLTQLGNLGALLTIYVLQFLFTRFYSQNLNKELGDWTLGIRDHLFLGEFMAFGLVILVIILVFSMGRREAFAQKLKLFLQLFLIATVLLSFATPILNFMDRTERFISDMVFWVYLMADPNNHEEVPKPVKDKDELMASFGNARNDILVRVGSQFWRNFRLAPWQMAEFGAIPKPSGKDENGKAVYSGRDKDILDDTNKVLDLNPLVPKEFVKREKLVAKWTNNSVWGKYAQGIISMTPGGSTLVDGANMITDLIGSLTEKIAGKDEKDQKDQDQYSKVKYPSMTTGNSTMRMITVVLTFFVGTVYGSAILFFSGIGIALKFVNVILFALVGFLLFFMFIPNWGWEVMSRWFQYFLITALYKVILSVLLIVILFVSNFINAVTPKNDLGMGIYLFAHLAFGLGLFIGIKLLWNILMTPARVINETGAILRNSAKKGASIGLGSVLLAGKAAAAAVTGNPAFLTKGGKGSFLGSIFRNKGKQAGSKGGDGQESFLENQNANYIPEGFNLKSSKSKDFSTNVMPHLKNPYQKDSDEAKVFDDIKAKGLNPYSYNDQRLYEGKHLKGNNSEERKTAFSNIKNDSREFLHRQKRLHDQQQKSDRMKRISEMAQNQREEQARKQEQQKKPSVVRRSIDHFKSRTWGRR